MVHFITTSSPTHRKNHAAVQKLNLINNEQKKKNRKK